MKTVWKFARHLFGALVLVTCAALLGVGLEHSRLSNIVAPHVPVVVKPVRSATSIHFGPPPHLAGWPPVIQLLGLMAAIVLLVTTIDTVQRASRRRWGAPDKGGSSGT